MGNIDENLPRNNVARQVERFCISYFAAFTQSNFLRNRGLTKAGMANDRVIFVELQPGVRVTKS